MSTATGTAGEVRVNAWDKRVHYTSTKRAAARLNYSPERIRQMCVAGDIPGARQLRPGGKWQVPTEWVNANEAARPIRRG